MKVIVNETQYNKMLKEQRGFSKVAEDWANIIVDRIMEDLFDIDGEEVLTMGKLSLKYGDEEFFKKLPIESILITIIANRIDGEEGGADASYVPHWSHIEDDVIDGGNVIEDVELNLDIDIPKTATEENDYQSIRDYIFQMFSHELLHVYEWFNRGLEDPAERKDCMGVFTSGDLRGNVVERLAYLIYVQLSFEMNAFIHQAGTMLRMRDINSYEEFKEELESLFIWDFVEGMLEFDADEALKEIEKVSDEDKILFEQMKMCYYSGKDEYGEMEVDVNKVSKTNKRFLKDLSNKFMVRGEAMKRKLFRLASDIL